MAFVKEALKPVTTVEVEPWRTDAELFHWEVWSWTTVYQAPTGFEWQAPYTIALLKGVKVLGDYQGEEVMVTAQLTDLGEEEVDFGMPVEPVVRRRRVDGDRGVIDYGIKFRPRLVWGKSYG